MKGIAQIVWVILALIIVAAAGSQLVPGILASMDSGEQCRDIYAYTPYWRCCVEKLDYSGNSYELYSGSKWDQPKLWTCPGDATKCEVYTVDDNVYYGKNCEVKSGFLSWYVQADNSVKLPSNRWFEIQKGYCVYIPNSGYPIKAYVDYKVYTKKLIECGTAGCTQGRTIKTGGCEFYGNEVAWDENGNLVSGTDTINGVLYTVPLGECWTYLPESGRHVIGNTCEECASDSDCAKMYDLTYTYDGKTYGAVCSAGKLQLYGCKATLRTCLEKTVINGVEKCLEWGYKKRCDVVHTIDVQCCPGTDSCGPNAVCDPKTFTCKETAKCTFDYDCGTGVMCDHSTKTLKKPVCSNGQCTYQEIQKVDCCYDSDCPTGYFCSADYKCLEKPDTKTTCPYQCCQNEKYYFDRPCPTGQLCCADHVCRSSCDDSQFKCNFNGKCEPEIGENSSNCRDCHGIPWWKYFIGSFIIAGIIELILVLVGFFIPTVGAIVKPLYNYKTALIVWITLSVLIMLFFSGIALIGANLVM